MGKFGLKGHKVSDQRGMVAITVSLVIMIIAALVVTSFALIVRKEQRQSLDRQLSTQAFYAAESGIDDVAQAIRTGGLSSSLDNCEDFKDPTKIGGRNYQEILNSAEDVQYTCVLVDYDLPNVTYDSVDPSTIVVSPINVTGGMDRIRIGWQNFDATDTFETGARATNHALPQNDGGATQSLRSPLLEVTLVPGFDGPLSRATIANESLTLYLYPNDAGSPAAAAGAITYTTGAQTRPEQGAFVNGNCARGNIGVTNYKKFCNADIQLPGGFPRSRYYLRVKPMYKKASIDIQALDGANVKNISESQIAVDVTGKASDVLRRIRVRIPYDNQSPTRNFGGLLPDGALETTDSICKVLDVYNDKVEDNCTTPMSTRNFADPL